MPDLTFAVEGVEVVEFVAVPTLAFQVRVTNLDPEEEIHTVVLRCQIQLDAVRRRYTSEEQERLVELFGEPARWGSSLRSTLWTHTTLVVPPFHGTTVVSMPVPCSFDFSVAATKYFAGLQTGDVPLLFLFSGTTFYAAADGVLQVAPISWDREARFRLLVDLWKRMMDTYYPNSVWLRVSRDLFDELSRYKVSKGLAGWDQVLESFLAESRDTLVKA
ncbi:MAG TPA: DUF6084 family protein [Candidatus Binatia bacterium]|nr:DUF6084 family protein [Candidatus Binatia bacterium]